MANADGRIPWTHCINWNRRKVLPLGCASVWRILGQDDRGEGLWLMKIGMSEVAAIEMQ